MLDFSFDLSTQIFFYIIFIPGPELGLQHRAHPGSWVVSIQSGREENVSPVQGALRWHGNNLAYTDTVWLFVFSCNINFNAQWRRQWQCVKYISKVWCYQQRRMGATCTMASRSTTILRRETLPLPEQPWLKYFMWLRRAIQIWNNRCY